MSDQLPAQSQQSLDVRLDVIEARLDDIVGMLGEVFDQMHPCVECIETHAALTTADTRPLRLAIEPIPYQRKGRREMRDVEVDQ